MKDPNLDPNKALEILKQIENSIGKAAFDPEEMENIQIKIRVNEKVAPAMFKPDPLIPGGYIANSLTIRAMRPDIFVLGDSLEDFETQYECACGMGFDAQFWKLCPFCGRELKS